MTVSILASGRASAVLSGVALEDAIATQYSRYLAIAGYVCRNVLATLPDHTRCPKVLRGQLTEQEFAAIRRRVGQEWQLLQTQLLASQPSVKVIAQVIIKGRQLDDYTTTMAVIAKNDRERRRALRQARR